MVNASPSYLPGSSWRHLDPCPGCTTYPLSVAVSVYTCVTTYVGVECFEGIPWISYECDTALVPDTTEWVDIEDCSVFNEQTEKWNYCHPYYTPPQFP